MEVYTLAYDGEDNDDEMRPFVINLDDSMSEPEEEELPPALDLSMRGPTEEKFLMLMEMFPDADPAFVQTKCIEMSLDRGHLELFVENTMLSGAYPKKIVPEPQQPDELGRSLEILNGGGVFNIESFLRKCPNPEEHFSRANTSKGSIPYSLFYLMNRHKRHAANVVKGTFMKNGYNMVATDQALSKLKATRKVLRRPGELKPPVGIPPTEEFLNEIKFIENRETILQYLADKAIARNNAVEEARKANALLTCGCCFSDDLLNVEVSNCSEGHIFCKMCILRSSQVLMGDGKIDFPCLQECTGSFSLKVLKEILPEIAFEKLEKKLQEREIVSANIPGLETCAFCEYSAIPPEEDREFHCINCQKQMCRLCRRESHIPLRCDEAANKDEIEQERKAVEEKMTDALLRTCWKCNAKFIREDGCNKMTCVCGAKMCYVCRKPVTGYSHFTDTNMNYRTSSEEQGSAPKCPLWTSNKHVHQEAVDREGRRAIDDLKRKNPDLELLLYKKKR